MYVGLAFILTLMLPVIAVIILVNTGINIISDSLVSSDPESQTIQILDPRDGSTVQEITATFMWPMRGAITLEFGESSLYQLLHTGIDISTTRGTQIVAFMDGDVTYAGEIFWGYGKHIIIDHGNNISTVYAHLDKVLVYEGQPVKMGDVIGNEGTTGWSTGPHLHFEIRVYGIPVNPRVFLDQLEEKES
jgi:murein DD-endopeptidase MepM/ murein hydrolase activator NlpD